MLKRNFVSILFVLGLGVVVFSVVIAVAFAIGEEFEFPPCNRHVVSLSSFMRPFVACSTILANCDDYSWQNCLSKRGNSSNHGSVRPAASLYFSSKHTNDPLSHAIVAGTILCSYEYYCRLFGRRSCGRGEPVIDPRTGKQKEIRLEYYENDAYCVPSE